MVRRNSDTVVFLDSTSVQSRDDPYQPQPLITHKGSLFSPRVLPIVRNSSVEFLNDDSIFHNVFSLSSAKPFDLGIYPQGYSRSVSFQNTGLIRIYCNIHPKMVASILVLNNSLYSLTDESGSYKIEDIPKGEYIIRVWSEFSDELNKTLSFGLNEKIVENFSLRDTKFLTPHKNKFGKDYKHRYK
jgi:hypothetical protein